MLCFPMFSFRPLTSSVISESKFANLDWDLIALSAVVAIELAGTKVGKGIALNGDD